MSYEVTKKKWYVKQSNDSGVARVGVGRRRAAGAGGARGRRGRVHVRGDVGGRQPHAARAARRHRAALRAHQRARRAPGRAAPARRQRVLDARLRRQLARAQVHRAATRGARVW